MKAVLMGVVFIAGLVSAGSSLATNSGNETAADPVRKLLDDEDRSVRKMAAWALGRIEKSQ